MKVKIRFNKLFILASILIPAICCGQVSQHPTSKAINENHLKTNENLTFCDDAELYVYFPGGKDGPSSDSLLNQFIKSNIIYPDSAIKNKIEGTVYISFTIDKLGKISSLNIVKSTNKIFNQEAVRVISIMPDWKWDEEIKMNKRKITKRIIPLNFKLVE